MLWRPAARPAFPDAFLDPCSVVVLVGAECRWRLRDLTLFSVALREWRAVVGAWVTRRSV